LPLLYADEANLGQLTNLFGPRAFRPLSDEPGSPKEKRPESDLHVGTPRRRDTPTSFSIKLERVCDTGHYHILIEQSKTARSGRLGPSSAGDQQPELLGHALAACGSTVSPVRVPTPRSVLTSIASSLQNCTRVGFRQSIHRHHTDHQGWM
jgi:hypothetical protein